MNYWWNYHRVIQLGTLWTCPRPHRATGESRTLIQSLKPGDIVFHHDHGYLRAVSRVTTSWEPWPRPEGYPRLPDEGDDGWLVRVDPIRTGLELHYSRVAELIRLGPGAPLNKAGKPDRKYLSALSEEEGMALLEELGVAVAAPPRMGFLAVRTTTGTAGIPMSCPSARFARNR